MKRWIYFIIGCGLLVSAVINFINVIELGPTVPAVRVMLWQILWGVIGIVFLRKAIKLFISGKSKMEEK